MKLLRVIVLFSVASIQLYGQQKDAVISKDSLIQDKMYFVNNLFKFGEDIMKSDGVQAAIDTLKSMEEPIIKENDPQKTSFYYQVMMTYYSFIDYEKSLEYEYKAFPYKSNLSGEFAEKIVTEDAITYITRTFEKDRVILINEAHHSSQHRAFLRDLLPDLNKKGFNYLLLEALFEHENELSKRRYPILTSGLYLNDPVFAQAIRTAYALDYKILPLERDSESENREEDQAFRIDSVLKADPLAKVVVFVGHDHIYKKPKSGYIRMGKILVDKLGHDVPAIELTLMREKYKEESENGYYKLAMQKYTAINKPFVIMNHDVPFVIPAAEGMVDFNVFFPRASSRTGLTDWGRFNDGVEISTGLNAKAGSIIKVFVKRELEDHGNSAIPVLQYKLDSDSLNLQVKVPEGEYSVQVIDVVSGELDSVNIRAK